MSIGYPELKLSWALFGRPPDRLSRPELARLRDIARKQREIERRILASPEARGHRIPSAHLERRVDEIRGRYPDAAAFARELRDAGLSLEELATAVRRDLHVEAVLEAVAATAPAVSIADAEDYWCRHREAFSIPERRRLRHILVTFADAAEKSRAFALLDGLRGTLATAAEFGAAALRHSQCPTALEGGVLGVIRRGQLFPELDAVAFALPAEGIGAAVETPVGLHLIRCDEILPANDLAFPEVAAAILERLIGKRRAAAQKRWIGALFQDGGAEETVGASAETQRQVGGLFQDGGAHGDRMPVAA